jgi:hypothetical protein
MLSMSSLSARIISTGKQQARRQSRPQGAERKRGGRTDVLAQLADLVPHEVHRGLRSLHLVTQLRTRARNAK